MHITVCKCYLIPTNISQRYCLHFIKSPYIQSTVGGEYKNKRAKKLSRGVRTTSCDCCCVKRFNVLVSNATKVFSEIKRLCLLKNIINEYNVPDFTVSSLLVACSWHGKNIPVYRSSHCIFFALYY